MYINLYKKISSSYFHNSSCAFMIEKKNKNFNFLVSSLCSKVDVKTNIYSREERHSKVSSHKSAKKYHDSGITMQKNETYHV